MGMDDYTKYQQKCIKGYYENIDQIAVQRLAELVGDLYLTTGKKRDKLWESVENFMKKLDLPQERIDHILREKKPELLASLVKELTGK